MEGPITNSIANRVYLWDNLKVILMLLVVITHSINVYQQNGDRWVQFFWIFVMSFTMPLFMIISGYWFKERSIGFILKQFLYPCVVFSVVNIFIGYLCHVYPHGVVLTKSGWAMWYIFALFVYSIVTPFLIKKIGIRNLLILSVFVSFIVGFKFFLNEILDAQRVVNFYPFYVFGIWCRKKHFFENFCITNKEKMACVVGFCSLVVIYFVLTYYFPGFVYGTGFMSSHGKSLFGFISKWTNYALCFLMSIAFIRIIPNRKLWFSVYGTRTMNVYLLHMSLIFPLSWFLMRPIMYEWFGLALYVVVPILICVLLFSHPIDVIMKMVLFNRPRGR